MCRRFTVARCFAAAALVIGWHAATGAVAGVTSSGAIFPDEPVVASAPQVELRIGDDFDGDADEVDPRAVVTVDDGTLFDYLQVFVGYDEGFFGRMLVSGEGTVVQLADGGFNSDAGLEVGRQGNGFFSLTDGATLDLTGSNSDLVIASDAGSVGEMLVDGVNTFVDLKEDILIGDAGDGRMTISGGALVRTTESSSELSIGDKATSSGVLTVTGSGTTLQLRRNMIVGNLGPGEMHIAGGALVDADAASSQATIGALGRVTLSGGTLDVLDLDVSGYLGGAGVVRGQVDVLDTGDVETGDGQRLDFHDPVNNSGAMTITGGELRFLDASTTSATGRLTLQQGVVRFSQAHANNGVIASAEGTSNLHGEITNNGNVVVASETIAVFNDTYTDAGTTTVLARGNALFLSNLTFTSASLLALGVAADEQGNNSAQVEVAGAAVLAGELALEFDPNFSPAASQSIELLFADGGVSGQFIPPVFPTIEGISFALDYNPNSVVLDVSVAQNNFLDGDFNQDGVVDAADYTVWRDGLGSVYGPQDYTAWRANYGKTSITPAASPSPAPSPSGFACLLAGVLTIGAWRRRPGLRQCAATSVAADFCTQ